MFEFSQISFGGASAVVNMPVDVSATRTTVTPADATATVSFNRNGTITNHAGAGLGDWVSPISASVGDGYDVKYDFVSGDTLSSGAAASGTYIAMTANRAFSNTQTVVGIRATVLTWSIRATGGGAALDTATGTITAEETV